jgi:hypothetical protein
MNEQTFVSRLGDFTAVRAHRKQSVGEPVLIVAGMIEERQLDPVTGTYKRCDMRLNSASGRKLASGEMKRPEVPEGRDPRNADLVRDARNKAVARGLPYYFTCNMAEVVLFSVAGSRHATDTEEATYQLAPIQHSKHVTAYINEIQTAWDAFLDDLENRLKSVVSRRPSVTTSDVMALRNAIYAVADEAVERVIRHLESDSAACDAVRFETQNTFGFDVALSPKFRDRFREDLLQILRLGVFVVAQKLILYRVLLEAGPRRAVPFTLDPLHLPVNSTDPAAIRQAVETITSHAISRSGDYETAFLPTPVADIVFMEPSNADEVAACSVGEVWDELEKTVSAASWVAISQNLVGFLYESIVEPQFRHQLGQHYTPEDVVDVLSTFSVRGPADLVLDPASGGGSFLRSAYTRKRDLGDTHEQALAETWGVEVTAFAAELSTISLATADTTEPAAYPRVLLRDFFTVSPGLLTDLVIPGNTAPLSVPASFDAVVGNPPYISYRHQTNHSNVLAALAASPLDLPRFTGKSDEYVWFIAHATRFLSNGGRLAFVVSSAILFADYGIPLVRFIGRYFRVVAVVDSVVERWFVEADTNTVLLLLEREDDSARRDGWDMRFVRLRRRLSNLLPHEGGVERREALEDLVNLISTSPHGGDDPRLQVLIVPQGASAGLEFAGAETGDGLLEDENEDGGEST